MQTIGVMGMENYTRIKCLHGHYAHYLSRPEHGNVVGKWIEELLAIKTEDEKKTEKDQEKDIEKNDDGEYQNKTV